jgi:hypothetical protein
MTRNIIILLIIIAAIFLVSYYYKPSSLKLSPKGVDIQVNSKHIFLESTVTKITPITFSNINIMQNKLSNSTYYEVATCESLYEFNQQTVELIKIIFDAEKAEDIFSIKGLRAMRVTLKNAQVINLFVDDNDMKELKIFYGITYETFSKTVESIMGKKFQELSIGGMLELPTAMTKWNVIHNDFDGVISSVDH